MPSRRFVSIHSESSRRCHGNKVWIGLRVQTTAGWQKVMSRPCRSTACRAIAAAANRFSTVRRLGWVMIMVGEHPSGRLHRSLRETSATINARRHRPCNTSTNGASTSSGPDRFSTGTVRRQSGTQVLSTKAANCSAWAVHPGLTRQKIF
jgi:hypothetical protein